MKRSIFQVHLLWRLLIAFLLATYLVSTSAAPVAALSPGDYFSFSYTVQFSSTQITGNALFQATVNGTATCTRDLPWPVSVATEASITSRVVAVHQGSGAKVTLNPGYTITIDPFPNQIGNTTSILQVVSPLQFPQGSASGTYDIAVELIEAKVKAITWIPVTSYLPSSQPVNSSINYVSAGSSGGGGGGGGGLAPVTPVVVPAPLTSIAISGLSASANLQVSSSGIVKETSRLEVSSMKAYLDIAGGTKMLDAQGNAQSSLSASKINAPPAASSGTAIIAAVDLGPNGSVFDPPIIITLSYDPAVFPEGVTKDGLYIAYWANSQWVALPSAIDTDAKTISAAIRHFTQFAVIGKLPPSPSTTTSPVVTPPLPSTASGAARFTISTLAITPGEVEPSQQVIISAVVTNAGSSRGEYIVVLKINGIEESRKQVIFDASVSQKVSFEPVKKSPTGEYKVDVNGLAGSFTVKGVAVKPVSTPPATPPPPKQPQTFSWLLIGGIIGSIIIGLLMLLAVRRRSF